MSRFLRRPAFYKTSLTVPLSNVLTCEQVQLLQRGGGGDGWGEAQPVLGGHTSGTHHSNPETTNCLFFNESINVVMRGHQCSDSYCKEVKDKQVERFSLVAFSIYVYHSVDVPVLLGPRPQRPKGQGIGPGRRLTQLSWKWWAVLWWELLLAIWHVLPAVMASATQPGSCYLHGLAPANCAWFRWCQCFVYIE